VVLQPILIPALRAAACPRPIDARMQV